ncbi:hypothetical protein Nepgr_029681 [Nepenthes gracilis]|uniref:Uncharacterized protein n=1 Tax=Nepenthes gracilis TaxID=150966 RepID=A0AAD3Y3G8_NEPGR|nr:hypothetical protein Nepgr_029681 [Nepenthes gracilis]
MSAGRTMMHHWQCTMPGLAWNATEGASRELVEDRQRNTKEAAHVVCPSNSFAILQSDDDTKAPAPVEVSGQCLLEAGVLLLLLFSGLAGIKCCRPDVDMLGQFDHPSPADPRDDSCYVAAGFAGHHGRVIVGAPLVASIENKNSSFVASAQP